MCDQIVYDWVIQQCYVIPCEWTEISMNYFERLQMLGLLG